MRANRFFPSVRLRAMRTALISACVLGAATAVVVAEQKIVQRRTGAEVQDMKGSVGEIIEVVPQNTTLEVLGREGAWVHVRTPSGKTGYISNALLEANSGAPDLSGVAGASNATGTGATAAGRGLDPDVRNYVAAKHLDPAALLRMQATRDACRGKTLRNFEKNGNVGPK